MVCVAVDRVLVVNVAVSVVVPESAPVAIDTPPSKNVTVPVGLAAALLPELLTVTVAVNVTLWPETAGFVPEVTFVVVLALLTVWVMAADVGLALKLPSPL